jgi:hypothetical protein
MVYLEYAIPRMGHRVDAVVLINGIVLARGNRDVGAKTTFE